MSRKLLKTKVQNFIRGNKVPEFLFQKRHAFQLKLRIRGSKSPLCFGLYISQNLISHVFHFGQHYTKANLHGGLRTVDESM